MDIRPTVEEFNLRQKFVLGLFADLAKKHSVGIIWLQNALCDTKVCQVEMTGRPVYSDGHHMTVFGAKAISKVFDPIFQ